VSLEGDDYPAGIREAAANRISGEAIHDALIAGCAIREGAEAGWMLVSRQSITLLAGVDRSILSSGLKNVFRGLQRN